MLIDDLDALLARVGSIDADHNRDRSVGTWSCLDGKWPAVSAAIRSLVERCRKAEAERDELRRLASISNALHELEEAAVLAKYHTETDR